MTRIKDGVKVHHLSPEEARRLFEEAAQRELGISGAEFLAALDSGAFDEGPERREVINVLMLLPLVRN